MSDKVIHELALVESGVVSVRNQKYLGALQDKLANPALVQQSEAIAIRSQGVESMTSMLESIDTSINIEESLQLSQACFASCDVDTRELDLWKTDAVHFIGHLMGGASSNIQGELTLKSNKHDRALSLFLREHMSENMDYEGVINKLMLDFNRLANQGYKKVVKFILFDLLLFVLKEENEIDFGLEAGMRKLLGDYSIDLKEGFSRMNQGWSDPMDVDLDLDELYEYEVQRMDAIGDDYRIESFDFRSEQLVELLQIESFLPEDLAANRLIRSMIVAEGACLEIATDIVNYLNHKSIDLQTLIAHGVSSRRNKLINAEISKIFKSELQDVLLDLGSINLKVWAKIQNLLKGREVQKPKRKKRTVAAKSNVQRIGTPTQEAESTREITDVNFEDFMDILNG